MNFNRVLLKSKMPTMAPCCPTYMSSVENGVYDLAVYSVVSKPPDRKRGKLKVRFMNMKDMIRFSQDEPVTSITEEARQKIKSRRTTPKSSVLPSLQ